MTQDEIICMARDAGLLTDDEAWVSPHQEAMERFAALVAAHEAEKWKAENKRDYENWKMAAEKAAECEREACAKVCDEQLKHDWNIQHKPALVNCAAAIRARGDK